MHLRPYPKPSVEFLMKKAHQFQSYLNKVKYLQYFYLVHRFSKLKSPYPRVVFNGLSHLAFELELFSFKQSTKIYYLDFSRKPCNRFCSIFGTVVADIAKSLSEAREYQ